MCLHLSVRNCTVGSSIYSGYAMWLLVERQGIRSSVLKLRSAFYLKFKWRESLVPAAAVIPAPLAYSFIVAVKRLVVGLDCF